MQSSDKAQGMSYDCACGKLEFRFAQVAYGA